jgi:proteasome assembly chaperone (PAC2) family protein
MGVTFFREPKLENPVLIASWPGIGNIGLLAVESLRSLVKAEELAEIEPMEFFYPKKVTIRQGDLIDLEFPASRFFYKRLKDRDIILFIGEEQPVEGSRAYAEGAKAYQMANLVIDVAEKYGCKRIYTSGAAVAATHHTHQSRVWAVPNSSHLLDEIKNYNNTVLMSDMEERLGQGSITGLNGLLLGVARKRRIDAICLMGEIPIYMQGFPIPYPKASKAVLEVLTVILGLEIDFTGLDELIARSEAETERLFENLPPEIKEQIDKLKSITTAAKPAPGPITEEDKKKILEDIDKLFKQGSKGE